MFKMASHVYIRLKKWIIDSALRILQNAEIIKQGFFGTRSFQRGKRLGGPVMGGGPLWSAAACCPANAGGLIPRE